MCCGVIPIYVNSVMELFILKKSMLDVIAIRSKIYTLKKLLLWKLKTATRGYLKNSVYTISKILLEINTPQSIIIGSKDFLKTINGFIFYTTIYEILVGRSHEHPENSILLSISFALFFN